MDSMRRSRRAAWLACLLGSVFPSVAANTTARLILSDAIAQPGQTIWAGLALEMNPGWHTYWRNPGDSGKPTEIKWTLPVGVTAGAVNWPTPGKSTTTGLTTYVYHDEVVLLVPLTVAATESPRMLELKAKVEFVECDVGSGCVPGKANVSATLEIGSEPKPSRDAAVIAAWREKLPQVLTNSSARTWWESPGADDSRPLLIEWDVTGKAGEADFWPYASDQFEVGGATERVSSLDGEVRIRKIVQRLEGDWPTTLSGVLMSRASKGASLAAFEAALAIGKAPVQ